MDPRTLLHALLRAPAMSRPSLLHPHAQTRTIALLTHPTTQTRSLSLPRIIQPSFWASMIPKPLKPGSSSASTPTTSSPRRQWNPATPYIILALLVGSQAIQTLWLKQERGHNLRKAEAKMGLLREVIERVQRGEKVPVERVLGTGSEEDERAWREVLDSLKNEESLFQNKKRRKALREEAAIEEEKKAIEAEAGTVEEAQRGDAQVKVESIGNAKFY